MGEAFDEVDQEGEQVGLAGVAAGLVALGEQHVGTGVDRHARQLQGLHLADGDGSGVLGAAQPRVGVGEGEDEHRHPLFEGDLDVGGVVFDELGDEADAEGPVGLAADVGNLLPQPFGAEVIGAAEGAQPAGQRDGGGQLPAAVVAHGGGHDGVVEVEEAGEAGVEHGGSVPLSCVANTPYERVAHRVYVLGRILLFRFIQNCC